MSVLENKLIQNCRQSENKIIIYGAGDFGRAVLDRLMQTNRDVFCFAVSKREHNPYSIWGVPVIVIKNLEEYYDTANFIIAVREKLQPEIRQKLIELRVQNIYALTDKLCLKWKKENVTNEMPQYKRVYLQRYVMPYLQTVENLCKEYDIDEMEIEKYICEAVQSLKENSMNILRLVVVLGTKCSLRCQECNNLMNHFKPQKDLDEHKIIESLKVITDKTQTILKCELIGGEPFLASNLSSVLGYVIDNSIIKSIEITTNGTVIPKDSYVIQLLQNQKVTVRISDYGSLVDKTRIVQFCEKNKIRYTVLALGRWISPGSTVKRGRDSEELKRQYKKCNSSYLCKTLFEDKLFQCARAASMSALNYMEEKEFLLVNDELDVQEMRDFFLREYSIACDYCDVGVEEEIFIQPAVQIES